jgi:hypothetical protein
MHRMVASHGTGKGDHGLEEFETKPVGNKSRFGYRGAKERYNRFKSDLNQKWAPYEEKFCRDMCEKHNLDPESFIRAEDNPNRKWHYAYHRVRKFLRVHGPKQ